jgi:hypothetical protein
MKKIIFLYIHILAKALWPDKVLYINGSLRAGFFPYSLSETNSSSHKWKYYFGETACIYLKELL